MKQKDLRKSLGTWNYIRATGRVVYAMPKKVVNKIKYNYGMTKLNIKDYVKDEANAEIKKRQSKVQDEIYDLYAVKREMKKDREYTHGSKKGYMTAVDEKIKKLKTKKKVIKGKGLGIFSLTRLALSKFRKNRKEEREAAKLARAEEKQALQIEKEKLQIDEALIKAREKLETMSAKILEQEIHINYLKREKEKYDSVSHEDAYTPEIEPEQQAVR